MKIRNTILRTGVLFGVLAVGACIGAVAPARADDHDRDRNHDSNHDRAERLDIRYDNEAIRRDRAHLRDLQRRRNDRRAARDWSAVRRLDRAIADTQWRIDHRRYDRAHDWDNFYSDRDRDWFRNHTK